MSVAAVADCVASTSVSAPSGRAGVQWRRQRAVELALAGYSYDDIAARVGYANRGSAWKAVQAALSARTADIVDEYRVLELERLEAVLAAQWDQAVAGDVRASELVLKVVAAEIRLLGLDRVEQVTTVQNTVVVGGTSAEYVAALQAIRERPEAL